MRTIEQAIQEEAQRYVGACRQAATVPDPLCLGIFQRRAHIHALAIRRLRHHVVTPHEALCAATPSVHAYADLDGYGR